ncbi:MAG: hypothetical protein A2048_00710 [Deltaproteobacteria bacterium GWA2_45_12]|nr:MAG: hypothetical protein A2048_00710 [Deltaproteobacteria bacterium GWA2_45_12]
MAIPGLTEAQTRHFWGVLGFSDPPSSSRQITAEDLNVFQIKTGGFSQGRDTLETLRKLVAGRRPERPARLVNPLHSALPPLYPDGRNRGMVLQKAFENKLNKLAEDHPNVFFVKHGDARSKAVVLGCKDNPSIVSVAIRDHLNAWHFISFRWDDPKEQQICEKILGTLKYSSREIHDSELTPPRERLQGFFPGFDELARGCEASIGSNQMRVGFDNQGIVLDSLDRQGVPRYHVDVDPGTVDKMHQCILDHQKMQAWLLALPLDTPNLFTYTYPGRATPDIRILFLVNQESSDDCNYLRALIWNGSFLCFGWIERQTHPWRYNQFVLLAKEGKGAISLKMVQGIESFPVSAMLANDDINPVFEGESFLGAHILSDGEGRKTLFKLSQENVLAGFELDPRGESSMEGGSIGFVPLYPEEGEPFSLGWFQNLPDDHPGIFYDQGDKYLVCTTIPQNGIVLLFEKEGQLYLAHLKEGTHSHVVSDQTLQVDHDPYIQNLLSLAGFSERSVDEPLKSFLEILKKEGLSPLRQSQVSVEKTSFIYKPSEYEDLVLVEPLHVGMRQRVALFNAKLPLSFRLNGNKPTDSLGWSQTCMEPVGLWSRVVDGHGNVLTGLDAQGHPPFYMDVKWGSPQSAIIRYEITAQETDRLLKPLNAHGNMQGDLRLVYVNDAWVLKPEKSPLRDFLERVAFGPRMVLYWKENAGKGRILLLEISNDPEKKLTSQAKRIFEAMGFASTRTENEGDPSYFSRLIFGDNLSWGFIHQLVDALEGFKETVLRTHRPLCWEEDHQASLFLVQAAVQNFNNLKPNRPNVLEVKEQGDGIRWFLPEAFEESRTSYPLQIKEDTGATPSLTQLFARNLKIRVSIQWGEGVVPVVYRGVRRDEGATSIYELTPIGDAGWGKVLLKREGKNFSLQPQEGSSPARFYLPQFDATFEASARTLSLGVLHDDDDNAWKKLGALLKEGTDWAIPERQNIKEGWRVLLNVPEGQEDRAERVINQWASYQHHVLSNPSKKAFENRSGDIVKLAEEFRQISSPSVRRLSLTPVDGRPLVLRNDSMTLQLETVGAPDLGLVLVRLSGSCRFYQWYAPQGKPWTQDSVRLRPDRVLTQQGSSPKPTSVGDKLRNRGDVSVLDPLDENGPQGSFKLQKVGGTYVLGWDRESGLGKFLEDEWGKPVLCAEVNEIDRVVFLKANGARARSLIHYLSTRVEDLEFVDGVVSFPYTHRTALAVWRQLENIRGIYADYMAQQEWPLTQWPQDITGHYEHGERVKVGLPSKFSFFSLAMDVRSVFEKGRFSHFVNDGFVMNGNPLSVEEQGETWQAWCDGRIFEPGQKISQGASVRLVARVNNRWMNFVFRFSKAPQAKGRLLSWPIERTEHLSDGLDLKTSSLLSPLSREEEDLSVGLELSFPPQVRAWFESHGMAPAPSIDLARRPQPGEVLSYPVGRIGSLHFDLVEEEKLVAQLKPDEALHDIDGKYLHFVFSSGEELRLFLKEQEGFLTVFKSDVEPLAFLMGLLGKPFDAKLETGQVLVVKTEDGEVRLVPTNEKDLKPPVKTMVSLTDGQRGKLEELLAHGEEGNAEACFLDGIAAPLQAHDLIAPGDLFPMTAGSQQEVRDVLDCAFREHKTPQQIWEERSSKSFRIVVRSVESGHEISLPVRFRDPSELADTDRRLNGFVLSPDKENPIQVRAAGEEHWEALGEDVRYYRPKGWWRIFSLERGNTPFYLGVVASGKNPFSLVVISEAGVSDLKQLRQRAKTLADETSRRLIWSNSFRVFLDSSESRDAKEPIPLSYTLVGREEGRIVTAHLRGLLYHPLTRQMEMDAAVLVKDGIETPLKFVEVSQQWEWIFQTPRGNRYSLSLFDKVLRDLEMEERFSHEAVMNAAGVSADYELRPEKTRNEKQAEYAYDDTIRVVLETESPPPVAPPSTWGGTLLETAKLVDVASEDSSTKEQLLSTVDLEKIVLIPDQPTFWTQVYTGSKSEKRRWMTFFGYSNGLQVVFQILMKPLSKGQNFKYVADCNKGETVDNTVLVYIQNPRNPGQIYALQAEDVFMSQEMEGDRINLDLRIKVDESDERDVRFRLTQSLCYNSALRPLFGFEGKPANGQKNEDHANETMQGGYSPATIRILTQLFDLDEKAPLNFREGWRGGALDLVSVTEEMGNGNHEHHIYGLRPVEDKLGLFREGEEAPAYYVTQFKKEMTDPVYLLEEVSTGKNSRVMIIHPDGNILVRNIPSNLDQLSKAPRSFVYHMHKIEGGRYSKEKPSAAAWDMIALSRDDLFRNYGIPKEAEVVSLVPALARGEGIDGTAVVAKSSTDFARIRLYVWKDAKGCLKVAPGNVYEEELDAGEYFPWGTDFLPTDIPNQWRDQKTGNRLVLDVVQDSPGGRVRVVMKSLNGGQASDLVPYGWMEFASESDLFGDATQKGLAHYHETKAFSGRKLLPNDENFLTQRAGASLLFESVPELTVEAFKHDPMGRGLLEALSHTQARHADVGVLLGAIHYLKLDQMEKYTQDGKEGPGLERLLVNVAAWAAQLPRPPAGRRRTSRARTERASRPPRPLGDRALKNGGEVDKLKVAQAFEVPPISVCPDVAEKPAREQKQQRATPTSVPRIRRSRVSSLSRNFGLRFAPPLSSGLRSLSGVRVFR